MGKYEPLEAFLKSIDAPQWRANFRELEKLLGFKLPNSALKYPAWWSNDDTGHSHARAWLEVGWRTVELDLAGQHVTFRRARATQDPVRRQKDPWGCMAGTVRIMPGTDLTVPTNETWSAEKGSLLGE